MEFSGIITAIKFSPDPSGNIYTVMSDKPYSIQSGIVLNLYDRVSVSADECGDNGVIQGGGVSVIGKASKAVYARELSACARGLLGDRTRRSLGFGIAQLDRTTSAMAPALRRCAKRVMASMATGSPVMVRFHNDCDGASGAIALFDAVRYIGGIYGSGGPNVHWQMNRSVAYSDDAFYSDTLIFNSYASAEMPLVLITDFGTTEESEHAISLAKGKEDFIWLDHHPVYRGFPKDAIGHYINPWDHAGNSDYTAGFLAATFSEILAPIDSELMKKASLIGDYSVHAARDDEDAKIVAVVLDYVTGSKGRQGDVTPKQMRELLNDRERLSETYGYASTLLGEALEKGMGSVRRYKTESGTSVFMLDFKKVSTGIGYPLPGRYSSWLQEKMEGLNGKDTITIVHYGNYISVRVGRECAGIDLLGDLEKLKASCSMVQSFGGHKTAASIKVEKENVSEVARLLLAQLGVRL